MTLVDLVEDWIKTRPLLHFKYRVYRQDIWYQSSNTYITYPGGYIKTWGGVPYDDVTALVIYNNRVTVNIYNKPCTEWFPADPDFFESLEKYLVAFSQVV